MNSQHDPELWSSSQGRKGGPGSHLALAQTGAEQFQIMHRHAIQA